MLNKEALSPSVSEVNPSHSSPKQLTSTNPQTSSSSSTVSLPKERNPTTSSPKPVGFTRTRKSQIPKKSVPTSTSSEKPNLEGRTHTMMTSQYLEASVETTEKDDGMEVTRQEMKTETATERENLSEVPSGSGYPTSLANVDISGHLGKSVVTGGETAKDSIDNVVAIIPANNAEMETEEMGVSTQGEQMSTIAVPWKESTLDRTASSEEEPGSSNHSEKVNSEGNEINSENDVVLRTVYKQRYEGAKQMKKWKNRRKHLADRKPISKQRKRPPTIRQKSHTRLDSALLVNKAKTTDKRWRRLHLVNLCKLRDGEEEMIAVSEGEEEKEEATLVRKNSKSRRTRRASEKKTVAEGGDGEDTSESEKEKAVAEGKKASKSPKKRKKWC
ncbi:uncharacterized protein LOC132039382 [Lycium ferocissimum]|uniref:uncharacterized protein LOC132039382 n=1 Tax=Lycium ferocissimum TaxID=112874 RepID=UPI002815DDB0|nr:uncharacterized protein LOC132039382 [Lycium ferocissimum]